MDGRFFISHIFFLVAFLALLAALILVAVRRYRHPKDLALAALPVGMIFLTAYLGKNNPAAHQVFNIFYDAVLIYNAYFFWSSRQNSVFTLYLAAIIATVLDFAMHFVF
jgi:uncharacterized membrane protein YozB (DUF420 family)